MNQSRFKSLSLIFGKSFNFAKTKFYLCEPTSFEQDLHNYLIIFCANKIV